jgi:rhodanese-related sulfurtransferase
MSVTRISPQEAQAKMAEGYTYIDVRSEEEFADGHPEGAVNIPIAHQGPAGMTPNENFVAVLKAHYPPGSPIILGCRSGGRSMRAAEILMREGYTGLLEQRAGWDGARDAFGQLVEPGWSRTSLPSAKGSSTYDTLLAQRK